ncbi:YceI family protein [Mucilaginibacter sp. 14171R-50]|uniref:YceI family protein n=1 Tax=Mucilaginibacter sp. 14171R-50 TaxID=2703789 RepID=UPI00138D5BE8|nr:YceI family protein [Mucilaginibacter sp. 14171R-50]QHS54599.1 YceI family protein [Mucilaginibacter sp. 14171R-50]
MKRILITIVILIITAGAFAQNKSNITSAKITFELKNLGIKTGGTIGGVQGNIMFDPANPGGSKIEATADANTINTDNSMRDGHLKGEDYFSADTYPKIAMSSLSFQKKDSRFVGRFNLTIKGTTKPVEVPFNYTEQGNTSNFKGSFKINRKDFGVGGSSMTMSDDVTIFIEARAINN